MTKGLIMSTNTSIRRIFIANRGEIARRISSTAQKLGIESVCLTDRASPPIFLREFITDFVYVKEESTSLYLDIEAMIGFAKAARCDAVHPGFGFLSENSAFAVRVKEEGLTWIGPNPGAIEAMASKATARTHALESKVPCLPGLNGVDVKRDLEQIKTFAREHGFPVLMKAAYGGGGKGMRIAYKESELIGQAELASKEALSSFGNSELIVEKYLPSPRHVEVQVLGDQHGNVFIFGDRDCSLQRRHQKILEEAPAPNIPDGVRHAMHEAARALAKKVNYDNAGTVEFLLDESTGLDKPGFFFLEMNTRLQVEHTVTEEVFGIDLVELQIKSSLGTKLNAELGQLKPKGHSIELRIYAEDPSNNFFPVPGPVRTFIPYYAKGVRWEIGLDQVDEITTRFDPMISKLICSGPTRESALRLITEVLEKTIFHGPRNNIPYLLWLVRHSQVCERPVSTHFIANTLKEAIDYEVLNRKKLEPIANGLLKVLKIPSIQSKSAAVNLFSDEFAFSHAKETVLDPLETSRHVILHQNNKQVRTETTSGTVQGASSLRIPYFTSTVLEGRKIESWVALLGHNWLVEDIEVTSDSFGSTEGQSKGLVAPVPGKVVQVMAKPGIKVAAQQALFVLESMKMQFEVKASVDGEVNEVLVSEGAQVQAGALLASLK